MDIYHASLLRFYMRKYDMEEPPTFDDGDHTEHYRQKHVKDDPQHLEERFYRWAVPAYSGLAAEFWRVQLRPSNCPCVVVVYREGVLFEGPRLSRPGDIGNRRVGTSIFTAMF